VTEGSAPEGRTSENFVQAKFAEFLLAAIQWTDSLISSQAIRSTSSGLSGRCHRSVGSGWPRQIPRRRDSASRGTPILPGSRSSSFAPRCPHALGQWGSVAHVALEFSRPQRSSFGDCGPRSRGAATPAGPSSSQRSHSTTCVHYCQRMSYNIRVKSSDMEVDVDKLRELRINQGFSQRRLAELAGVSNTSVWKIEQGGGANPATLKKLADVLGVRPVDLLKKGR